MKVHAAISYGISSNVYVVEDKATNEVTLIDTGYGPPYSNLIESLRKLKIDINRIKQVLITHRHRDHTNGLKQILREIKPTIYIHKLDAGVLAKRLEAAKKLIVRINEEYEIKVGDISIKALHTPGHTAGSICYLIDNIIFSGDLVFANGSFGRTDLPTGNISDLIDSLKRISKLEVNTLLPGHGEVVLKNANAHIKLALKMAKSYFKVKKEILSRFFPTKPFNSIKSFL